jgi:hypothetical protein
MVAFRSDLKLHRKIESAPGMYEELNLGSFIYINLYSINNLFFLFLNQYRLII